MAAVAMRRGAKEHRRRRHTAFLAPQAAQHFVERPIAMPGHQHLGCSHDSVAAARRTQFQPATRPISQAMVAPKYRRVHPSSIGEQKAKLNRTSYNPASSRDGAATHAISDHRQRKNFRLHPAFLDGLGCRRLFHARPNCRLQRRPPKLLNKSFRHLFMAWRRQAMDAQQSDDTQDEDDDHEPPEVQ
jgi:hypothetical protein